MARIKEFKDMCDIFRVLCWGDGKFSTWYKPLGVTRYYDTYETTKGDRRHRIKFMFVDSMKGYNRWDLQNETLIKFKNYCEKNNIKYSIKRDKYAWGHKWPYQTFVKVAAII